MKSNLEIFAEVYLAAFKAIAVLPKEHFTGKNTRMDVARLSAEKTVAHFRMVMGNIPECNADLVANPKTPSDDTGPAVPSDLDDNKEAGVF